MELKFVEDNIKESPKKDMKFSRTRNQQKGMKSNRILEAIAQVHGAGAISRIEEDGSVHIKILVKKDDLKKIFETIRLGDGNNIVTHQALPSLLSSKLILEQRLNAERRRHSRKAEQHSRGKPSTWRPSLKSIPEES